MDNNIGFFKEKMDNMCRNLKWLRITHGLSEEEMAKKLKIAVRSLSKIEKGEVPQHMSYKFLLCVYNEFFITPDKLLNSELEKR